MQTLGSLLDAIRTHYVTRLRAAIGEERAIRGAGVYAEPALRGSDGAVVREGVPATGFRVDLAIADGSTITIETETILTFEPIAFVWNDIPVRLGPFSWASCRIVLNGHVAPCAHVLEAWFERWFDAEECMHLEGVVHSIAADEPMSDGWCLLVDLGSAPAAAFEELLDAFVAMGSRAVHVGSMS